MIKYLMLFAAMFLFVACGNNDSAYEPAVKSKCRTFIAQPMMAMDEEGATTTDDTLLSDDDDFESIPFEEKVVLITQEPHHLVFLFTTAIQCGDDMVYSTKTAVDIDDPTTVTLRIKGVDTDPNRATPCSCATDFTITVDDAEHDLSLVKSVVVISASGTEKTFEF